MKKSNLPLIKIKNLSKKFFIANENQTAFRFLNYLISTKKKRKFYALKNINFQVDKGDRIGLIGANGSGKTTLLRIIAGLYKKTMGKIEINGHIAAFLHTDVALESNLSALENIYLLGMIMGLKKEIIKKNMNNIIDFAQIKKFIHIPLRKYSSGMIQRLVLSVLRFVEADVFLFDEIIESGDIKFKHKCYKIILDKISKQGKAAIISSHEIEIIEKFCNRAILLDRGKIIAIGPSHKVLHDYLKLRS
jgi:ABC-type polysaccharide/polyol phosphate transport system ATPase subunit